MYLANTVMDAASSAVQVEQSGISKADMIEKDIMVWCVVYVHMLHPDESLLAVTCHWCDSVGFRLNSINGIMDKLTAWVESSAKCLPGSYLGTGGRGRFGGGPGHGGYCVYVGPGMLEVRIKYRLQNRYLMSRWLG